MKKRTLIIAALCCAAFLLAVDTPFLAQDEKAQPTPGKISGSLKTVSYTQAMYSGGLVPDWDRGYVIQYEARTNYHPDSSIVLVYDADGNRVREVTIWPTGATSVRIRRTAATHEGAILAAGWAVVQDGSVQHYLVKTDLAGNTVQTLFTGSYYPEEICEASDGTIWSMGETSSRDVGHVENTDVLRHYSFEKGLLQSFLPQSSVEGLYRHSTRPWFNAFANYVRCGKNKVSVYLKFTNEYVEVDMSSLELTRWKLGEALGKNLDADGLAVTEDGRVYASFRAEGGRDLPQVHGLFQIKAVLGQPVAKLLPVAGTISRPKPQEVLAPGTFVLLWGADGNQLVVWRIEADRSPVSWVNVIQSDSTD